MNTVSWETWPGITLPSVELLLLVSRQTCVATCLRWKWHNLFIVHISCPQIWPSLGEAPQALCLLGLLPLLRCDCCRCRHQLLPCSSLSNAHHIIRMLITLINNSTNKFHPSYQALHWPLNTVTNQIVFNLCTGALTLLSRPHPTPWASSPAPPGGSTQPWPPTLPSPCPSPCPASFLPLFLLFLPDLPLLLSRFPFPLPACPPLPVLPCGPFDDCPRSCPERLSPSQSLTLSLEKEKRHLRWM